MKKILYVATSDVHINVFHLPFLKWLKEQGCLVHLAVENRGDIAIPYVETQFNLPFPRSPLKFIYIKTYKALKTLIEKNNYDIIHCHTPLPSVITRLAAIQSHKAGTKVLYTAHGFHFYKQAPLKNWLIYYPVEYILSFFTDAIIVMNREDFNYINNKMLHKNSFKIPGMGVDPKCFHPVSQEEKNKIRNKSGYPSDAFIVLYIADFIPRKNHKFIIKSLPSLAKNIPNLKLLFAGKGITLNNVKNLVNELKLNNLVDFLGFRNDIPDLCKMSDIGISSSQSEGLPIGILQEIFCGIPIVATIERGHNELIVHGENGFLFEKENINTFVDYVVQLYNSEELRIKMSNFAAKVAQKFTVDIAVSEMGKIYKKYLLP